MLFADLGEESGLSVGPTGLRRGDVSHPTMMPGGFLPVEVSDGEMAAANGRSAMPPVLLPMVRTERRDPYFFGQFGFGLGDDVSIDTRRSAASVSRSNLSPLRTNPDSGLTTRNPGTPLPTSSSSPAPAPSIQTAPAPFLPLPPKEEFPDTPPTATKRFPWWWIAIGVGALGAGVGAFIYLRR